MKNKSKPFGRPKLPETERRSKAVSFKTTASEYETILQKSKAARMSPGVYCRSAAICKILKPRLTPGEVNSYKAFGTEIHNLGINLNIVAKKAGSGLQRDYANDIDGVMSELKQILNNLKEKLV